MVFTVDSVRHSQQAPSGVQLPSLSPERVLPEEWPIVDLRSPGEFAEDRILRAVNRPLFDDAERVLVGTLYKQVSPEEAYARGLEITTGKVAELVKRIAADAGFKVRESEIVSCMQSIASGGKDALERRLQVVPPQEQAPPNGAFVVHCWRAGLRSQSVCALLRELGLPAYLLAGGYKAYRRLVLRCLATLEFPRAFVLRGLTGVGKTLVLREIERLEPGSTLDLEELAQHRSSILGAAGLKPASQRLFESRLLQRYRCGFPAGFVFYEGESRKVGSAIQPERVWDSLCAGGDLRLVASMARRVRVLSEDYLESPESRPFLERQLPFLEQRIGPRQFDGVLVDLLREGRTDELVEVLLERYYDPLYRRSEPNHQVVAEFDSEDPTACAKRLLAFARAN